MEGNTVFDRDIDVGVTADDKKVSRMIFDGQVEGEHERPYRTVLYCTVQYASRRPGTCVAARDR